MSLSLKLNKHNVRRMSERSNHTSVTVSTSTSTNTRSGSCSTATSTPPAALQSRGFADMSSIRIPIVGYEVMEERARFTVYKLRIENPFTNDCWLVLRRYTDFVRLNKKLKTLASHIQLNLPRKNLFGNNFSNSFLEERVQGLQTYVNSIMANELTRNVQAVKDFFCLEEPPTYSDSLEECRSLFEAQEETICHLKLQLQSKDEEIAMLQQKLAAAIHDKDTENQKLCEQCTKNDCLGNYSQMNSNDVNSNTNRV